MGKKKVNKVETVESKLSDACELINLYRHTDNEFTVVDYSVRDDDDDKNYKIIDFIGGGQSIGFSISNALWNDLGIEEEETIDILLDATEDAIAKYTTSINRIRRINDVE